MPPRVARAFAAVRRFGRDLFAGDWAGAAIAVGTGFGVMVGLGLLAMLLVGVGGVAESIGGAATAVGLAAGGSLLEGDGPAGVPVFRPLGLAVAGFWTMAALLTRRLRQRPGLDARTVLLQAVRAGLVLPGAALIIALLSRIGGAGVGVASTMFSSLVAGGVAVAAAASLRLPVSEAAGRWWAWHRWAGPVRAVLVLTVVTGAVTLAGVIAWTVLQVADGAPAVPMVRGVAASVLLGLPNLAGAAFLFGLGVPARGDLAASFGLAGTRDSVSIVDLVQHHVAFLAWPAVVALLLAIAARSGGRRAGTPDGADRAVPFPVALTLVLPVALLGLARALAVGVDEAGSGAWLSGSFEFNSVMAVVLGAAWGAAVGAIGTTFTREHRPRHAAAGRAERTVTAASGT